MYQAADNTDGVEDEIVDENAERGGVLGGAAGHAETVAAAVVDGADGAEARGAGGNDDGDRRYCARKKANARTEFEFRIRIRVRIHIWTMIGFESRNR